MVANVYWAHFIRVPYIVLELPVGGANISPLHYDEAEAQRFSN